MPVRVTVAVEDAVSASVALRLVGRYAPGAEIERVMVLGGINNLRGRMRDLAQIARREDLVLALADMDRPLGCPLGRVRELSGGLAIAPNLLIRIAVLEIESWIMADREGLAEWLGIAASAVPLRPERVQDPKRALVQLAARSRNRGLREAIVPRRGLGSHRVGPFYNDAVGEFVAHLWDPDVARRYSGSLERAVFRVAGLVGG